MVLASAPLLMLPSFLNSMDMLLPLILFMFALATVWLIPLFGWVVIACAGILAVQIALIGVEEFAYLWTEEQVVFILAYVGLAILARLGWRAVRGRVVPALMQG